MYPLPEQVMIGKPSTAASIISSCDEDNNSGVGNYDADDKGTGLTMTMAVILVSPTVSSSGTSVTWLGTSMPCTQTSLSTVKVTEQSRMEVFRQWGSCIMRGVMRS